MSDGLIVSRIETPQHPLWRAAEGHLNAVFGVDHIGWAACGGWGTQFTLFVLARAERVLATVGVTDMTLIDGDGLSFPALQLSAVATRAGERGRGHGRRLLQHVLREADLDQMPVMLCARPEVTAFYPRFGFRRLVQYRFSAVCSLFPAPGRLRRFDPWSQADRQALARIVGARPVSRGPFSAAPDWRTILWYLMNTAAQGFFTEAERGFVAVEPEEEGVILRECLGDAWEEPAQALAGVLLRPVRRVVFGFCPPPGWASGPVMVEPDPQTLLFLRGIDVRDHPFRLPDFAIT